MPEVCGPMTEKFMGFDKWDISSAVSSLKEAEDIKKKGSKFLKAVQAYADEDAEKAKAAASKIATVTKVKKKLDKTYGNPHPKGGY